MAKPTRTFLWQTSSTAPAPTPGEASIGYQGGAIVDEGPPNYHTQVAGEWVTYLDDYFIDTTIGSPVGVVSALSGPTNVNLIAPNGGSAQVAGDGVTLYVSDTPAGGAFTVSGFLRVDRTGTATWIDVNMDSIHRPASALVDSYPGMPIVNNVRLSYTGAGTGGSDDIVDVDVISSPTTGNSTAFPIEAVAIRLSGNTATATSLITIQGSDAGTGWVTLGTIDVSGSTNGEIMRPTGWVTATGDQVGALRRSSTGVAQYRFILSIATGVSQLYSFQVYTTSIRAI